MESNHLQRSASVSPAGDGGIFISVRVFVRCGGRSGEAASAAVSRSQRPWAQRCCQRSAPAPRGPPSYRQCSLCSWTVLGAFGQGQRLLLGISLGRHSGAGPGPGCLQLRAGERALAVCRSAVGAEQVACGSHQALLPPSWRRFPGRDVPVPKQVSAQGRQVGGQCDIVLTPGSARLLVPGAVPGEAVRARMETCSAAALRSDPLVPVLVAGEPRQAQVKLMEAISFS